MILAMRHSRRLVFVGVVAALAAMTVLSIGMGQVIALLPKNYVHFAEVALFIGFGLKLLYDATQMTDDATCEEVQEAKETVEQSDFKALKRRAKWGVILQAFGLTFMAEWGDRTQIATIALAASNNPWGVSLGAILGHTLCAAIAIVGGRLVAGRISERMIIALGGVLFLIFGVVAIVEGWGS